MMIGIDPFGMRKWREWRRVREEGDINFEFVCVVISFYQWSLDLQLGRASRQQTLLFLSRQPLRRPISRWEVKIKDSHLESSLLFRIRNSPTLLWKKPRRGSFLKLHLSRYVQFSKFLITVGRIISLIDSLPALWTNKASFKCCDSVEEHR